MNVRIHDAQFAVLQRTFYEDVMTKVIFAVLLMALALFLIVPNLSWAF